MPTITFTCPHCSSSKQLPASAEGMKGNCPSCKTEVVITPDNPEPSIVPTAQNSRSSVLFVICLVLAVPLGFVVLLTSIMFSGDADPVASNSPPLVTSPSLPTPEPEPEPSTSAMSAKLMLALDDWHLMAVFSPDPDDSDAIAIKQAYKAIGTPQNEFFKYGRCFSDPVFSPDGKTIVIIDEDDPNVRDSPIQPDIRSAIWLWDVATEHEEIYYQFTRYIGGIGSDQGELRGVDRVISPNGKRVVGRYGKEVRVWDISRGMFSNATPEESISFLWTGKHSWATRCIALSPDGKTIASGDEIGKIKLWDSQTGAELHYIDCHLGEVEIITFSPDSKLIASAGEDETVKIVNVQTGLLLQTIEWDSRGRHSVAFSPDGNTIAAGSALTINLWHSHTGTHLNTLEGPFNNHVETIAFSPNGKIIASGSWDHSIMLWDSWTERGIRRLTGHSDDVTSVAFSPDGKTLVSGSDDATIKLWDVDFTEYDRLRAKIKAKYSED